jgi:hypothetical protein
MSPLTRNYKDGDDTGDDTVGSQLIGPHASHHNELGAAVDDHATRIAELEASGGVFVNANEWMSTGFSAAANRLGLISALAAGAGKTIVISPGTYNLEQNQAGIPTIPANTTILADGVKFKWPGTITEGGVERDYLQNDIGSNVRIIGLEIEGPDSVTSSSAAHLFRVRGDGGTINGERMTFRKGTFSIWNADNGTSTKLSESTFFGKGPLEERSTAILFSGSSGTRTCFIDNCEFYDFGLTGSNLYHCLYIDDAVESRITNSRFFRLRGNGFYIQWHDGLTGSKQQLIDGCYFGAYHAEGPHGIQTSNLSPTKIVNSTFNVQNQAIEADGDTRIVSCTFYGDGTVVANNFLIVGTETAADIYIKGCDFVGTTSNPILIDFNNTRWTIESCLFKGSANKWIVLDDNLTTTTVRVVDNDFHGAIGQYCIEAQGGGILTVARNRFHSDIASGKPGIRCNAPGTLARLEVLQNDFSQGGSVSNSIELTTVRPTSFVALNNYGTKGYKNENSSGSASVPVTFDVNAQALIAHGLGSVNASQTPTKWSFAPTGAGGNRQIIVIGVDTTNITIEYREANGTLKPSVTENIRWWAGV